MKNDDVMDLIVVFCILFVFMRVLYCFCVATEFSYIAPLPEVKVKCVSYPMTSAGVVLISLP